MAGMEVVVIERSDASGIRSITTLFDAMYAEMKAQGLMLELDAGGADRWLDGVLTGIERFGRLVVVKGDQRIVGFAHAVVKLTPDHLGALPVGFVSHVYVEPAFRRTGAARRMVELLDAWFAMRHVQSVELQVVHGNLAGIAFWNSLGYQPESLLMRRVLPLQP